MQIHLPVLAGLVLIGLTLPVGAQEISEQKASQVASSINEAFYKAWHAKDTAAVAALYTEDAVRVGPSGPQIGRAAIEKAFAEVAKAYDPEFEKVIQVKVRWRNHGDCQLGRNLSWSEGTRKAKGLCCVYRGARRRKLENRNGDLQL